MCGIIGKVSRKDISIMRGLNEISHRGPDYLNENSLKKNDYKISLGHARLSVIDLNPRSNQPFNYRDRYYLVFNGEIYNYKNLKKDLIGEYKFQTSSDTEVLLFWLIKYGMSRLNDLEGMFSFCFYDSYKNDLFLVRDHLGIKPVYYKLEEFGFSFCSEIKGLNLIIDKNEGFDSNCIHNFLLTGFMIEPNSGFIGIKKVKPGHFIHYNCKTNSLKIKKYWNPKSVNKKINKNLEELIDQTINQHLISDVPVGVFFSGGVDSSILSSRVPNDSKFLISKSDKRDLKSAGIKDDYYYAKKISKHFDFQLTEIDLSSINEMPLIEKIKIVVDLNEEPIADFTSYPTMLLSKKARELGLVVMLSGMGADEIFAGYPRYLLMKYRKYSKLFSFFIPILGYSKFFSKKISRFKEFLNASSDLDAYLKLLTPFNSIEISGLTRVNMPKNFMQEIEDLWQDSIQDSVLKTAMTFDIFGFLSHNFLLADKASMNQSIEMRVPLATKNLFEYTMTLNDSILLDFFTSKKLLKKYLISILPKKLIYRRKTGFHPPLDNEILGIGKENLIKIFSNKSFEKFINLDLVKDIIENHFTKKENNTYKIYRLLFLNYWIAKNCNN